MKKLIDKIPREPRKAWWRGIACFGILVMTLASSVGASVLVAPTVVVLSEQNRTGRIIVRNPSDSPKEISIFFRFGLPESDSLGNVIVALEDSAFSHERNAVPWLRAFPRKMVLPPGAQQTIRFMANPPKDLPNGEYWARVVVQSQDNQPALEETLEEGQITARINMVMQTAISLKYRTGDLMSQVEMTSVRAFQDDDVVKLLVDLSNRGNVSYLGVLTCRLLDARGREISSNYADIAVYYDLRRKMELKMPEGDFETPYQVEFSITTSGRTDLATNEVIPGNEIATTVAVE